MNWNNDPSFEDFYDNSQYETVDDDPGSGEP